MEKIKDFIRWLGEKLFPDLPERKKQRITVQIIAGISLALVCMTGMGIFRDKAEKQLEKYQVIADVYAQLDPDTLINFPVVGTDDNAFYLSYDFTGDKSSAGCPFMDKDTQIWDFNRVIYGHNMGIGSDAMFSTLLKYAGRLF